MKKLLIILLLIGGCAAQKPITKIRRPKVSVQQEEARRKLIEKFVFEFGKRRQRKKCLLYEVSTAAQAQKCFDCHDLWKEWEQKQL